MKQSGRAVAGCVVLFIAACWSLGVATARVATMEGPGARNTLKRMFGDGRSVSRRRSAKHTPGVGEDAGLMPSVLRARASVERVEKALGQLLESPSRSPDAPPLLRVIQGSGQAGDESSARPSLVLLVDSEESNQAQAEARARSLQP